MAGRGRILADEAFWLGWLLVCYGGAVDVDVYTADGIYTVCLHKRGGRCAAGHVGGSRGKPRLGRLESHEPSRVESGLFVSRRVGRACGQGLAVVCWHLQRRDEALACACGTKRLLIGRRRKQACHGHGLGTTFTLALPWRGACHPLHHAPVVLSTAPLPPSSSLPCPPRRPSSPARPPPAAELRLVVALQRALLCQLPPSPTPTPPRPRLAPKTKHSTAVQSTSAAAPRRRDASCCSQ